MSNLITDENSKAREEDIFLAKKLQRRSFLQYAGAGAASVALLAAGCKKDKNDVPGMNQGVDLGSGDIGILNYAYALEQLEAAFYTAVINKPYASISALELEYLTDIRDHEVAHREFFKNAIPAANRIPALEVDFSKIDFTKRDSVLGTAKAFEDLGVAAYNGAGHLIKNGAYLLLAGKIVSVEARHAALIRDLISNGSFASIGANEPLNADAIDKALSPAQVLTIAGNYIKTKINASNLPK